MKMDPQDIKDYRQFREYVSVRIPQVAGMPFIMSALKRFSGNTSEKAIKEALQWNKGPTIQLVAGLVCGTVDAEGCYAVDSNILQVEKKRVEDFEKGKGLVHTSSGKLVYFVGVTLLHELCHWANDGTGAEDLTHEKFEQALYGKVLNASD